MSRFRLIQPHLEKNRPLQTVAADGKVPFRTAQRWVSQYRKFGLIALARKTRADRGARRVISPKLKEAIEALALESPPLPVRSIWRQIRQFAETIGEPPPRYGLVYDLIREIPVGLLTLAHRGGKTYSEKFDLVHRWEAPRSNAIWQADHAQLGIALSPVQNVERTLLIYPFREGERRPSTCRTSRPSRTCRSRRTGGACRPRSPSCSCGTRRSGGTYNLIC
jgi:putative transposase